MHQRDRVDVEDFGSETNPLYGMLLYFCLSSKTSVPNGCNIEKGNQYNPSRFFRATSILKKSLFLNNTHFLSFTTAYMIISCHLEVRLNCKAQ